MSGRHTPPGNGGERYTLVAASFPGPSPWSYMYEQFQPCPLQSLSEADDLLLSFSDGSALFLCRHALVNCLVLYVKQSGQILQFTARMCTASFKLVPIIPTYILFLHSHQLFSTWFLLLPREKYTSVFVVL